MYKLRPEEEDRVVFPAWGCGDLFVPKLSHDFRVGRGGPWIWGSGGGRGHGPGGGKDCEGVGERLWGRTRSCWKLLALAMWLWWRNSCLGGKEGSWAVDPDPCPCLIC